VHVLRADAKEKASLHYQSCTQEFVMKTFRISGIAMIAGLLMAAPAFSQPTSVEKQHAQDGNSPTTTGPGNAAYKQRTQDGGGPPMVGPGSAAYKQN
jgi:hypothetical protein